MRRLDLGGGPAFAAAIAELQRRIDRLAKIKEGKLRPRKIIVRAYDLTARRVRRHERTIWSKP